MTSDEVSVYLDDLHQRLVERILDLSTSNYDPSFEENVLAYLDGIRTVLISINQNLLVGVSEPLMSMLGLTAMTFFAIMMIAVVFMFKIGRR